MASGDPGEDRSRPGGHRRGANPRRPGRAPEDPGALGRRARHPVRLTRSALDDIEAIHGLLAHERGDSFAVEALDELAERLETLERFPAMGALRRDLGARPVRLVAWKAWILVYEHDGGSVLVARVLHGHRDLRGELCRDPGAR